MERTPRTDQALERLGFPERKRQEEECQRKAKEAYRAETTYRGEGSNVTKEALSGARAKTFDAQKDADAEYHSRTHQPLSKASKKVSR